MLKNKLFVVLYFLLHDFGFVLYLLWPLEKVRFADGCEGGCGVS